MSFRIIRNSLNIHCDIVDDYTRCTWVFLMKYKRETPLLSQSFYSFVETQFNEKIKVINIDNGLEFFLFFTFGIQGCPV